MATAYIVLALILRAYWYGVLPAYALQRIDRHFFFSRQKEANHRGRRVLEEVILIFSDQQLLTGLGVLITGYILTFNSDLTYYHWRYVVSLAWMSSTVHLMSLSVLRGRLWRNPVTCTVRLCAIGTVFALLIVAFIPTVTSGYKPWAHYPEFDEIYYNKMGLAPVATPARCLWNGIYWDLRWGEDQNTLVSTLIMVVAFAWKLCQFFPGRRNVVRLWGRFKIESCLEAIATRILHNGTHTMFSKFVYKLTIAIYVTFVAHMEVFEAFMTTLLLLAYTLVWGTLKLIEYRGSEEGLEEEWEMGFGQVLPLLLLVQPALATLEILGPCFSRIHLEQTRVVADI
ncbi:hypothetical protein PG996_009410 [Apiospora saccharicola]|uniref:Uncharacterized protein n=1 Tax=Apiospora saccharicola TaxID=335842 RepID=A0ABR1UN43_9PEZI